VLRAASDDVVPHTHTDLLVAKLGQLVADDIVPDSDHMNIPYLEATQDMIAGFLTRQFSHPVTQAAAEAVAEAVATAEPPAEAVPTPADFVLATK